MNLRLPLLLLLSLAGALAQDPASSGTKPKAPTRSLRLLPLGEPPPYRQEIRDGIAYELEPDADSVPPRQVVLGEGKTAATVRLNLGRATEPIRIPIGTAPAVLNIPGATADAAPKPWLTIHPPEEGDLLALAWREPGKPWKQARTIVLPDSAAAFPAGNIRIVNLMPTDAAAIFGDQRVVIPPGKVVLRAVRPNVDLTIQLAFKNATSGEFQQFFSSAVLLNNDERVQIFLHRADGEKPRVPAKAVIFNEATPPPPPAKP